MSGLVMTAWPLTSRPGHIQDCERSQRLVTTVPLGSVSSTDAMLVLSLMSFIAPFPNCFCPLDRFHVRHYFTDWEVGAGYFKATIICSLQQLSTRRPHSCSSATLSADLRIVVHIPTCHFLFLGSHRLFLSHHCLLLSKDFCFLILASLRAYFLALTWLK